MEVEIDIIEDENGDAAPSAPGLEFTCVGSHFDYSTFEVEGAQQVVTEFLMNGGYAEGQFEVIEP